MHVGEILIFIRSHGRAHGVYSLAVQILLREHYLLFLSGHWHVRGGGTPREDALHSPLVLTVRVIRVPRGSVRTLLSGSLAGPLAQVRVNVGHQACAMVLLLGGRSRQKAPNWSILR